MIKIYLILFIINIISLKNLFDSSYLILGEFLGKAPLFIFFCEGIYNFYFSRFFWYTIFSIIPIMPLVIVYLFRLIVFYHPPRQLLDSPYTLGSSTSMKGKDPETNETIIARLLLPPLHSPLYLSVTIILCHGISLYHDYCKCHHHNHRGLPNQLVTIMRPKLMRLRTKALSFPLFARLPSPLSSSSYFILYC